MRRDYFTLDVDNLDRDAGDGEPGKPVVHIDFHGPEELLRERLTDPDGEFLSAKQTDVAFRFRESVDDPDATGVVGVTDRITGDFILELNEDAEDVLRFIRAAREYGQSTGDKDGRYRIEISIDGEDAISYEKGTFLVYDTEGNLLRGKSLIPSGIEL